MFVSVYDCIPLTSTHARTHTEGEQCMCFRWTIRKTIYFLPKINFNKSNKQPSWSGTWMICLKRINDFHTTLTIVTTIIVHHCIHHHRAPDGRHQETEVEAAAVVAAVEDEVVAVRFFHTHHRCGSIHVPIQKVIRIWMFSSRKMWWCSGLILSTPFMPIFRPFHLSKFLFQKETAINFLCIY